VAGASVLTKRTIKHTKSRQYGLLVLFVVSSLNSLSRADYSSRGLARALPLGLIIPSEEPTITGAHGGAGVMESREIFRFPVNFRNRDAKRVELRVLVKENLKALAQVVAVQRNALIGIGRNAINSIIETAPGWRRFDQGYPTSAKSGDRERGYTAPSEFGKVVNR
jgi:hypothetical protein